MGIGKYFSSSDITKLNEIITLAEKNNLGEIVPVIVSSSDEYPSSQWKFYVILSLICSFVFLFLFPHIDPLWTVSLQIILLPFGFYIGSTPIIKRLLISKNITDAEVHQRALEIFLEKNIHNTKNRTGVLIFISLLERRAEIICDIGINKQVPPDLWKNIVNNLVQQIKIGNLARGLEMAIIECGKVIEQHFPSTTKNNELKNEITFKE